MNVASWGYLRLNKVKYTLFGLLFGLAFPLMAAGAEAWTQNLNYFDVLLGRTSNLMLVINSAPLVLGTVFFFIGLKQDKITYLYQSRVKKEVAESQARLEEAETIGKHGSWELDVTTMQSKWSKGLFAIFELDPKECTPDFDKFMTFVLPSDRALIQDTMKDTLENGKRDFAIQYRVKLKRGELRHIRGSGRVIANSDNAPLKMVGTVQDITDIVLAQAEAHFYKISLDQTAIVATTNSAGIITYANDKFTEVSGYSREELLGKDHRILNSKHHSKDFFSNLWKTISAGTVWRGEVKNRRKDGTYYWVDSTIIPMKGENDQISQYIAIRHEISERKLLEENLIRAKDDAIAARAEADAATQAKARFLANMSHEIRTPMNGIIGMSNLLLSNVSDPVGIERLKIIQNCGNSLLDLINDVLDFSKLEVDKVELEKHPFPIHDTAREIVELLNTRASEKGVILSYKHDENVPDWLLGDVTRFRQVLTNLVSNSIKFTEVGSVEIVAHAKNIEDKKWQIEFAIKDTGIGIPDHVKSKLFQSFSQVDASTTRRFGGTGLGLAICKGLCEKMGGSVWVESEVGKGSIFYFTISGDIAAPLEFQKSSNPFASFDPEMGKKHPLRILVAEDNRTNQLVAVGLLGKLGYQADIAGNGRETLKAMKTQQYDLILMDCHMPEMDGFQATKRIIEEYGEQRPRIVALTASTMKEDIDQCTDSGMDGFLGKPITLPPLVKMLSECRLASKKKAA